MNVYILINGDGYDDSIVGVFSSVLTALTAVREKKCFDGYIREAVVGEAHTKYLAHVDYEDGNLNVDFD